MKRLRILGFVFVLTVCLPITGLPIVVEPIVIDNPIDVADGDSATVVDGNVQSTAENNTVTVPFGETVTSNEDGVPGIQTSGGSYTITVDGTVNSYNAVGVNAQGSGNTITNNSVFTIETTLAGDGIVSGDQATVENNGEITSAEDGIVVGDNSFVDNYGTIDAIESGIVAGDNSFVTNYNGATIESDQIEVLVPASGIHIGDDGVVTNGGDIISYNSAGIHAGDGNFITNEDTGYIEGVFGIVAGDNNVIINDGTGELPAGEPTDPEGVIMGDGFGIVVQYDPSTIDSEEDLISILYENLDPTLLGNIVINDGWVNLNMEVLPEGPEYFYGIFGLGNNTLINNNATYGFLTGLGGLEDNTIINDGLTAGFLSGILARNDNTVVNSGMALGFDFDSFGLSGMMAGVGNTITNTADGYIGMVDPDFEAPIPPSIIGIVAYDNNLITNAGVIAGQGAGILVSSYPLLEEFLGGPIEDMPLPDYLTDYVPVGNTIINNGSIYIIPTDGLFFSETPWGIMVDSESYWDFITDEEIGTVFFNDITNNGLISSYYNTGTLTAFPGGGIDAGDFSEVTNNGIIDVTLSGIVGYDGNYIVNNGEIYSDQEEFFTVPSTGIHVEDFNYVENNGLIDSTLSGGIVVGYNSTVINNGTINASATEAANGIDGQDDNIVENYGAINATGPVIAMETGLLHSHGIHVLSNNIVTNYNTITASTAGIEGFGDNNLITNETDGQIFADDIGISVGRDEVMMVALETESELTGNTVINKGTIGDDPYNPSDNLYNTAVASGIIATGPVDVSNNGTIHSSYVGISTAGDGDTVTNDGTIYVYGNDNFSPPPGIMIMGGDAGISVGASPMAMAVLEEDTTPGVGSQQALYNGIINTVMNYGTIDAYDENQFSGATGIRAGYNTLIMNDGRIDAYYDGIEAQDYNIVHNTYNGVINSDLGFVGRILLENRRTGIDVGDYNIVTNDGVIDSNRNGISVNRHNEVTNNGRIEAMYTGIGAEGFYNIIHNASGAEIIAGQPSSGGYGISTGGGNFALLQTNSYSDTRGVTDEQYILDNIRNVITNDGYIRASDTGISAGSYTQITNTAQSGEQDGEIHGGHTGISANTHNIVTNNGLIRSDFLVTNDTGISLGYENIVTNNGTIRSETSRGISAGFHNNIFNNGTIDADTTGIYGWEFNRIENMAGGVINADIGIRADIYNNVINDGLINSATLGISAGNNNEINNTNEITSESSDGIYAGSNNDVTNSGTIVAYNSGIFVEDSDSFDPMADGSYNTATVNVVTNTETGSITGAEGIYMNGPGIISAAGDIEGTSGIAIKTSNRPAPDVQYVTIESGAEIVGDIYDGLYGDGGDHLTFDGMGTFNYNVANFEYVEKTGDGIWVLTGEINDPLGSNWAYNTAITGGTLQVDGNLGSDVVYVRDGGTLAGTGTIYTNSKTQPQTVYNYGTIAPGDAECDDSVRCSIDTLTIDGDFVQVGTGNLDIELVDDGGVLIDKIIVNGQATFGEQGGAGGTVTALPLNYIPEGTYTFYNSADLVVDADPTLIAPSALLAFTLGWDDEGTETMWLEVAQNTFDDIGGNQNDQNIFDGLNEQAEGGNPDAEDLIEELVQSDDPVGIMNDLTPEQYPNLLDVSRGGFGIYRNSVTGRMGNLHLTHAPQDSRKYATSAIYEEGPSQARIPAFENQAQGWSSWGRVLGMTGDQDSDNGIMGYDFDTYGVSFGFDNKVNDTCAFGLGFGMANSDVSFDGGQDTDMDSYHVGLYGTHSNERYYVDAALLMAFNDYDSTRKNSFVNARSSTDGKEWGIYLGGGYKLMDTDTMYFMPTASLEYANVDIDGFTETGTGGPLYSVSDYDADSVVTTAGFRWGGKMVTGETRFEPELRVALAHEFGDTDRDITASFAGTSTSFTISGVEPDETSVLVGLGANFFVKENMTLYADYDGEYRDGFDGHAFSAGIRYNF